MSPSDSGSTRDAAPSIACITGASSGIGAACAKALARQGRRLLLCGRRRERLEALVAAIEEEQQQTEGTAQTGAGPQHAPECRVLCFDVRDSAAVADAFAGLPADWQAVDVLVNNAGNAHGLGKIQEGSLEDWDAMIDGNVQGLLYVSRALMPGMVERKRGHIVNISSVAGKHVYPGGAVYCASKHAVEAISEGMRLDLTEHGIKVTNIAPGLVQTEFSLVRFKGDADKADRVYQGFDALQAEDIAEAVAWSVAAPAHVTIADMTIYAAAQAAPTVVYCNPVA
jgi:NADP-dependent 3-hydroxy acid dehydrogenase YdfG